MNLASELENLNLGDYRLNKRAHHILNSFGISPGRTIPQVFKSRNDLKACYEFLNNNLVDEQKLLEPHFEKTLERIRECPIVLLPSDTTELDYATKCSMEGRERITNTKKGLWLQASIAVTPQRLTLGVIEANFWGRESELPEDSSNYRYARGLAPIEEKESFRWIQSYRNACDLSKKASGTQVISILDREADIIELYLEAQEQKKKSDLVANFIVRSKHNRTIEVEDSLSNKTHIKLKQRMANELVLGTVEFQLPQTRERKVTKGRKEGKARAGRQVRQEVRATTVTIVRPNKRRVQVNVVLLTEINAPEEETPIVWCFITDLEVSTFEKAQKVVQYYLCRWEIELFFNVLKNGCKVEERQLQTADRMKNLIALFLILSWRVMHVMMLGRECPLIRCDKVFEDAEWKAVVKIVKSVKNLPKIPPTLGELVEMIASLGGYVKQKRGNPPGVKVMWKGLLRTLDFALAWEAFGK